MSCNAGYRAHDRVFLTPVYKLSRRSGMHCTSHSEFTQAPSNHFLEVKFPQCWCRALLRGNFKESLAKQGDGGALCDAIPVSRWISHKPVCKSFLQPESASCDGGMAIHGLGVEMTSWGMHMTHTTSEHMNRARPAFPWSRE